MMHKILEQVIFQFQFLSLLPLAIITLLWKLIKVILKQNIYGKFVTKKEQEGDRSKNKEMEVEEGKFTWDNLSRGLYLVALSGNQVYQ